MYSTSAQDRLSIAKELARLPCSLVHDPGLPCTQTSRNLGISSIPICFHLSTLLLEGPEEEVASGVRKTVYDVMGKAVRHHSTDLGERLVEVVSAFLLKGMKDGDRRVRLAAGFD